MPLIMFTAKHHIKNVLTESIPKLIFNLSILSNHSHNCLIYMRNNAGVRGNTYLLLPNLFLVSHF